MNPLIPWNSPVENIYFEIEKAKRNHLISEERAIALYEEINNIIYQQVCYFNHGASTSISKKGLYRIVKTINYLFIHGFRANDKKDKDLKTNTIQDFFDSGYEIIIQDIETIKTRYEQLKNMKLPFHNDRYISIIEEQIPNYLTKLIGHNAIFHYCFIEEDLDYPLLDGLALYHDMYNLQGSDLLLFYIERLYLENYFCYHFKSKIPYLIEQFESLKGIDIEYISINLLEIILNQLVANYALRQNLEILLKEEQLPLIKTQLQRKGYEIVLTKTIQYLSNYFSKSIIDYIETYKSIILNNIKQFINLDFPIFIYEKAFENNQMIILDKAADHYYFLEVLSKLEGIEDINKKIGYLKEKIKSVYDIIDLLDADIFYDDEYVTYFDQLLPLEIAILLLILHPNLRAFNQEVHFNQTFFHEFNISTVWMHFFKNYLHSLDGSKKITSIEKAINTINIKCI